VSRQSRARADVRARKSVQRRFAEANMAIFLSLEKTAGVILKYFAHLEY